MHIKNKPHLKWPSPLITPLEKRDKSRYCYFHEDHEHDTSNNWALKEVELIRQRKLKEFIEETSVKSLLLWVLICKFTQQLIY